MEILIVSNFCVGVFNCDIFGRSLICQLCTRKLAILVTDVKLLLLLQRMGVICEGEK